MSLGTIGVNTLRLIHAVARGPGNEWLSAATVDGYDPTTHKVTCRLQPSGRQTGALGILGMWPGAAHALRPGYQGAVGLIAGRPFCFFGTLNSDEDVPPDAALSIDGDVFTNGVVTGAGGLATSAGEVLPTANAAYDARILVVKPSDGSLPGKAYICLQSTGGTYHWILIATAP